MSLVFEDVHDKETTSLLEQTASDIPWKQSMGMVLFSEHGWFPPITAIYLTLKMQYE